MGRDPRPLPSAVTIESAGEGSRETIARTGTSTGDMSTEPAPDYSRASASSSSTSIYAARDSNGSTVTISRMSHPTTNTRNAAQTPWKRRQDENTSGAPDKEHLGVPNDACHESKRSVMCGSHL